MNIPVFDLHCDTALELLGRGQQPEKSLRQNDCHIDLERAGKLAGYCQCFACYTTPFMEEWMKLSPVTVFEKEIEVLQKALEDNHDILRQAFTAADVEANLQNGMMSAIFTIEGAAGFPPVDGAPPGARAAPPDGGGGRLCLQCGKGKRQIEH